LNQARVALGGKLKTLLTRKKRKAKALERMFSQTTNQCPCCKKGEMILFYSWEGKYRNKAPPFLNKRINGKK